jgi:hypothetical protein
MSDNESLRDIIEDKIGEWHELYPDDNSVVELHDFLGLTWDEYSMFVEYDILPGEPVPYEKFENFRYKFVAMSYNFARCAEELKNHKEVIKKLREGIALSRTHFYGDELHPYVIEDLLNENEV